MPCNLNLNQCLLQVSSHAALQGLCQIGAHLIVRLALTDTYPYTGHLPWGSLSLLSSLVELSVTPATSSSLAGVRTSVLALYVCSFCIYSIISCCAE